jgi:peptidoglycan hydrolase-like protein with peptidoglycan-binding domain
MSGAPVWVERGPEQGGRVMVGIHTAGTVAVNSGILIGGTARAFIRSHSFTPQGGTPPGRPQVKLGSKGATVIELQYRLNIFLAVNATGLAPLKVDGIFGSKTHAAARAFQKAMGLVVDGIVGPQTWRRLQLPF